MKKYLVWLWLLPVVVGAREVMLTTVAEPYQVVPIDMSVSESQLHLGELDNFPVMYEFAVAEAVDFSVTLAQPALANQASHPFTLLLVRLDERGRGVTEVGRVTHTENDWVSVRDSVWGTTVLYGSTFNEALESGTYRLEVSTPDNFGKYLLSLGPNERGGYFSSLGEAWQVQQFLGYSPVRMLTSSLVYYPIGILILGILIQRTWKYRKLIKHAN
jgi:hypothetical protein